VCRNTVTRICLIIVFSCWVLPIFFLYTWKFFRGFFHFLFGRQKKKTVTIEKIPPQLIGTSTFQKSQIQFADDKTEQGSLEILPGDYRFFLIRLIKEESRPFYAVLTTDSEPPSFDELLELSCNALENRLDENVQKFELLYRQRLNQFGRINGIVYRQVDTGTFPIDRQGNLSANRWNDLWLEIIFHLWRRQLSSIRAPHAGVLFGIDRID
jgi:hypothetical protein